jgi:hypothetical protein
VEWSDDGEVGRWEEEDEAEGAGDAGGDRRVEEDGLEKEEREEGEGYERRDGEGVECGCHRAASEGVRVKVEGGRGTGREGGMRGWLVAGCCCWAGQTWASVL